MQQFSASFTVYYSYVAVPTNDDHFGLEIDIFPGLVPQHPYLPHIVHSILVVIEPRRKTFIPRNVVPLHEFP